MSEQEEAKVDIKGTLEKLVKTDEPELEQEEAIKRYGEKTNKKSASTNNGGEGDDQAGGTEEQEHLKRVKQELLASLERVKILEKKTFGEDVKSSEKKKTKAEISGGKGKAKEVGQQEESVDKSQTEEPPKLQEQPDDKQIER